MDKIKIIKVVTNQIVNMLYNDILCGNGVECFESWCADGEVFENEGHSKEDTKEIMSFVEEIAPLVDDLVCNKLNIDMC